MSTAADPKARHSMVSMLALFTAGMASALRANVAGALALLPLAALVVFSAVRIRIRVRGPDQQDPAHCDILVRS